MAVSMLDWSEGRTFRALRRAHFLAAKADDSVPVRVNLGKNQNKKGMLRRLELESACGDVRQHADLSSFAAL